MPHKKGHSKSTSSPAKAAGAKMSKGGAIKPSKGVQGPFMVVKKKDGNRPVKIYSLVSERFQTEPCTVCFSWKPPCLNLQKQF